MLTISSREQVFTALFSHLQANAALAAGFKTFSRKLTHMSKVTAEDCPALFMEHSGEMTAVVTRQPSKWVLELNLWIYTKTENQAVGPILNPLLDVVEKAVAPSANGEYVQTLGGLVAHCWIEGQTQIFEGNLGDEAIAIIPVKILVT